MKPCGAVGVQAACIRIEWTDSAYNVGIDNITYTLLVAGLFLVGAAARRKAVA